MFTSCGTPLDGELRTFCRTVRRVARTGKVKDLRSGAEVKASVKSAVDDHLCVVITVSEGRPETG